MKRRKPQSSKKNAKYNIVYIMIVIIISNFKSKHHFYRSLIGKKKYFHYVMSKVIEMVKNIKGKVLFRSIGRGEAWELWEYYGFEKSEVWKRIKQRERKNEMFKKCYVNFFEWSTCHVMIGSRFFILGVKHLIYFCPKIFVVTHIQKFLSKWTLMYYL